MKTSAAECGAKFASGAPSVAQGPRWEGPLCPDNFRTESKTISKALAGQSASLFPQ